MARNYAAVFHEYLDEMENLTDEEFGRLMRGLLRYSATGELFEATGNEKFYVRRVMTQEDRIQENYEEERQKKSEAGKKGAAARWENGNAINRNGKNGNIEIETE